MPNPVPHNIGIGKHVYTETLIMGFLYLCFFLLCFLLCLITRQQTIFFLSFYLLFIAIVALAVYVFRESAFLLILFLLVFLDIPLELGLATYRFIVMLGFCTQHHGCLEAFIPYAIMVGVNLGIALISFQWWIQIGFVVNLQRNIDKLGEDGGPPIIRKPIEKTPKEVMDELYEDEFGYPPPALVNNKLVRMYMQENNAEPGAYGMIKNTFNAMQQQHTGDVI